MRNGLSLFDPDEVFDEDYLWFYETFLTDERREHGRPLARARARARRRRARHRFDLPSGRSEVERFVVRDGSVRRTSYAVRFFSYTELRDWLLAACFDRVDGYDREGGALTAESGRMIVIGTR